MSELPQGWELKKGSEVFDIVRGVSYDKQYVSSEPFDDAIAILRANNIQSNGIVQNDLVYVPKRYVSSNQLIQTGDIIIATSSGSRDVVGKTALANTTHNNLSFGAFCSVARPKPLCLDKWLAYFTQSRLYRDYVEQVALGININNFRTRDLASMTIPLPPLEEQRRIVAKLDVLLGRNKVGRQELTAATQLIKRQRQAVLAQAFSGELTADWREEHQDNYVPISITQPMPNKKRAVSNTVYQDFTPPSEIPDGWNWYPLSWLGTLDRGKSRHRPRNASILFGGPYPFIQTGDVREAQGYISKYSQTYSEFGLSQSKLWPKGTLCITIAANIAETAILGLDACFPDSIVGFVSTPQYCDTRFIELFIRTVKDDLAAFAPATAQKNINLEILSSVFVPIPSLEEQRAIVARIEAAFARIDEGEQAIKQAFTLAERLEQATLAKAFRGEL